MTQLAADIASTFTAEGAEPFTVDATLEAGDEETLVILGPSGSGKTLLLETVAGFHGHDGTVTVNGTDIADRAPERRDFGFVFQDYALFPHMTVRDNVRYGAQYCENPRDAEGLLAELGVAHLADRTPPTLSGGEKQRVALARALAVRPDVLLLDEPLAALDVPTRQSLRDDLVDVLADVTSIYVTHNRTTARAIADRIIVMAQGQVVQRGTPDAVFERPESPIVANFTGSNVIELASTPAVRSLLDGDTPGRGDAHGNGTAERVAIRPEAVRLDDDNGDLRATVRRVVREDATHRVTLAFDEVTVESFTDSPPEVGTDVVITLPRDRLHPC
ncbi:ABC transporter [Halobellus salinus]|uniref:Molybdate/tungstate import ATP-binding protein WtpC n=1 Tax=Halobellus salinus TaxID=931585 RepID=A0A830ED14_9EURY|nr:ABC transporter ATP-binding protein [Halobellus salinus]GGJ13864.1 ABC transporter [Halobellus salinus]SMP30761.1 thiamine transport system ATP-binding protein [Halobellus salinus]